MHEKRGADWPTSSVIASDIINPVTTYSSKVALIRKLNLRYFLIFFRFFLPILLKLAFSLLFMQFE